MSQYHYYTDEDWENEFKDCPENREKEAINNKPNSREALPVYESNATPEQRAQKLRFMGWQIKMIKEQVGRDIAADKVTVKCGCNKKIKVLYAYRCRYCGIFYCASCAEEHFGYLAQ